MSDIPWEILPFMDQALKEFWGEDGDDGFSFGNRGDDEYDDEDKDCGDDWDDDEEGWY